MNGERILLKKKKNNKLKEPLIIIEHSDLTPEERKAVYKFFTNHPEKLFGERKNKKNKSKSVRKE